MTASTPDHPSDTARAATGYLVGRLVRTYMRRFTWSYVGGIACMLIVAAATAGQMYLLKPIVDGVFIAGDQALFQIIPFVIVAVALTNGFANLGQSYLMSRAGLMVIGDLQRDLFRRLIDADLATLNAGHTGELTSRFVFDVTLVRESVTKTVTAIGKDSVTALALIGVMLWHDWQLAVGALIVLPVALAPLAVIYRRVRKASKRSQIDTGAFSARLQESFVGVRHVKANSREDYETARVGALIDERTGSLLKAAKYRAMTQPISETMAGIAVAVAIVFGGYRMQTGELTVGEFTSFIASLFMAYRPLKSIVNLNAALQEGLSAADRVFRLLDRRPAILERPQAQDLALTDGHVVFDRVSFAYEGAAALEEVSIDVPAGAKVALVGPSGAGKSTLVNLLPRFYDVDVGGVRIDGMDIRDVSLASLRRSIALVSQETFLFDDTVRANIAYAVGEANDAAVERAARAAQAHDFIVKLPDGYDTRVGEGGVRLSGGQRQRLAIARAMLKDAPILLLDEATSALDNQAERQVQAALDTLSKGRTTLVVAHRLSTVMDADRIYVLEHGRVVEEGRHADLVAQAGVYAHLWRLQVERGAVAEAEAAYHAAEAAVGH